MTCFEAQSLIIKYLNNDLKDDEMAEFLSHIDECSDCSEELEIYYTLITGMRQLEEDRELTANFALGLKKKIAASKSRLIKLQKKRHRKIIYLAVFLFVIAPAALGIESSQVSDKNLIVYTDVKTSSYALKYNFEKNFETLDAYVSENEQNIRGYIDSLTEEDKE